MDQFRKVVADQKYKEAIRQAANETRETRRKEEEAEAAAAKEVLLNGKTEQKADSKPPKLTKAPNGVPSIMSWKQRDDGMCTCSRIQSTELADRQVFACFM